MSLLNSTAEKKFTSPIRLAAPGAGIPWIQKMVLVYYLKPFVISKTTWEQSEKMFIKTHHEVLRLLESIPKEHWNTPVLVPPLRGLEDSSRFWSPLMVVEHLLIVNPGIRELVVRLSYGKNLQQPLDVGKLKPTGEFNVDTLLERFKNFISTTLPYIQSQLKDKNSKAIQKHPWFGDFTSAQWFWLLSGHTYVHIQQLKEIKKGLGLN